MSMIHLELEFSGALLPVETNEQGKQVVPLKPIVEIIGLEWERQRKKVSEPYLTKRLGTCTVQIRGSDQLREMICIRLDRVAAFLNTVNPENVRGQGNQAAADFLEAKHEEWDNLIDAYERGYGILAKNGKAKKSPTYGQYLAIIKAKEATKTQSDRSVMETMARTIAADLGCPYQEDLLDGTTMK